MRRILLCGLIIFLLALIVDYQPVAAQNSDAATSVNATNTLKKIEELTSKLSEKEISALANLLEVLAAGNAVVQTEQVEKPNFAESVSSGLQAYRSHLWKNIVGFPVMISGGFQAVFAIFKDRSFSGSVLFVISLAAMLAIGMAAEFLATRFARRWRDRIKEADQRDLVAILKTLTLRLAVELAGLAAFVIAAWIAARLIFTNPADRFLATAFLFLTILIVRLMSTFLRFILAPKRPTERLVSTDDWTAQFIYSNFVVLTGIVGVSFYILTLMNNYDIAAGGPLRFWVGLYVFGSIVYVTWRARNGLTSIIKGQDEHLTPGLQRMAAWWPVISIVVILLQYLVTQAVLSTGSFNISPATSATTLAVIVLAPFIDTMSRGLIKHLVPPMQGEGPVAEAAYHRTRHSYARIGRIALFAVLFFVIGLLWGVNFSNLAASSGIGAQLASKLVGMIMILAVGYLIWETVNLLINRQLAKDIPATGGADQGEGEAGGVGKSRMATVLPLVRMAMQAAIVTITILLALSQLGVNITPLLAGAGVLGLAIGFGAQTLVKDVVSGVFFLLDDAIRVGEYIDVGGTVGTVQKISVRSLQLRHPNGPVHIIPYGEIPKLTNHSRDYVIMKLRFTVPFDTDLDKVRRLFKKIGQEMMEIPALAQHFIQPFKSQGAADVNDVGIIVRGKFTTKPGAQWAIRKEVYSRVQKAFEENGIDFARREVLVQIPGLEDNDELDENQKEAIKLAAGTAASAAADKSSGMDEKKQLDPN